MFPEIYFLTSNKGKFKEVNEFFSSKGISIKQFSFSIPEPRASIEKVAELAVDEAYKIVKAPVFVEDTGLFIPSLNNFPGEFSKWVVKKIGIKGILKLLEDKQEEDRKAYFKTVIAFHDGREKHLFSGICNGYISNSPRGNAEETLPYDLIFIPNGHNKTFAEDEEIKRKSSQRIKALEKFYDYLSSSFFF